MKIILMLSALFIGSFAFAGTRYTKDPQTGNIVKTVDMTSAEADVAVSELTDKLSEIQRRIDEAKANIVIWTEARDRVQAEIDSLNASK